MARSDGHQFPCGPVKVAVDQLQATHIVGDVGVETGRDEHHLGRKLIKRRHHLIGEDAAKMIALGAVRQRDVEDITNADLAGCAGFWKQHPLVRGGEKDRRVGSEYVLRAVAVVDIKIHDRHPFKAVNGPGVRGADGDIVKKTKAHRLVRTGVVPWRAHGAKGVVGFACHNAIDGGTGRAGGSEQRIFGLRRQAGICIDFDDGRFGDAGKGFLYVLNFVYARELRQICFGRWLAYKRVKFRVFQARGDFHQSVGGFGITTTRVVVEAFRVAEVNSGHDG